MTTEITEIINGFKQFSENPYADTIKFLKEYIEVDETNEAFFELGKALFFNESYDESIYYLEKCNDFKSDAYLGLCYFKKKDYSNAVKHFKKFLNTNTNETILTYLMLSYEKESEWENAANCGEKLLEINPNKSSVKLHLIDYYINLKQYEVSLTHINELNDEQLNYKKGLALFNLKRYEEALNVLKSLKTAEAYKLSSEIYEKLNKPSKAIRTLKKSYELDGDIETLFEIADLSFKNNSNSHGLRILEEILITHPDNEKAHERIIEYYYNHLKFDLALISCKDLLKINENNIYAHVKISKIYFVLRDEENALKYIEKGLSIDPENVDLWILKAKAYESKDFDEYLKICNHALKLDPNNTENFTRLIWNCAFEDRMEDAHKYYDKLMFYNPTFTESFERVIIYSAELRRMCTDI